MRDIYRKTIEQCQIGVKARDIHRFAQEQFRAQGYDDRVSLVGHGVGPWWHQQEPYIVSTSRRELEEGMVLAMEPHVAFWHLQDMIQITRDGPRLISTRFNTDEMLVVG